MEIVATDFRIGVPLTYGVGRYQTKLAYYHLSSHLGDEFMLRNPGTPRINYSREVIVWGHSWYGTDSLRLYGEVGWAFHVDGGSSASTTVPPAPPVFAPCRSSPSTPTCARKSRSAAT